MYNPFYQFQDCEINYNDDVGVITININNKIVSYDEKDKPVFDMQTGEVVVEYTGLSADQNPARSWAKAKYSPNGYSRPHHHTEHTEDYYIISGEATVIVDRKPILLTAGSHIRITPNQVHQVINSSKDKELILIVKCVPAWSSNDFHLEEQQENIVSPTMKPIS